MFSIKIFKVALLIMTYIQITLPFLFLIAVEILAIAVRAEKNIRGIEINGTETKLLQFADDTTAVLSDLNSAKAFFGWLEKVSGLKLNVEKTEAMWSDPLFFFFVFY